MRSQATVALQAGTVEITANVNLFALEGQERAWFNTLCNLLALAPQGVGFTVEMEGAGSLRSINRPMDLLTTEEKSGLRINLDELHRRQHPGVKSDGR